MTARILVVDDIALNVELLEARLTAEYFEVLTATNGVEALAICEATQVDLILLDIMMPEMDGFETCERLKANPLLSHIPVIMVTALDQPADRVRGLKAGADDFLTKPVNDLQLISRVKSLLRLKALSDELRSRAETARKIGIEHLLDIDDGPHELGRVLLVDGREHSQARIVRVLRPVADVVCVTDPQTALLEAADANFDLVIVNSNLDDYDPLRLCSQFRSLERTRMLPILIATDPSSESMIVRALDLGVNDYVIRPIDPNELVARTLTQIRRKRYNDRLRESLNHTIELAVIDPLTGLNNRRYLETHLSVLFDRAVARSRPLSLLIADIDRFKQVNDTFGHDIGDEVLRQFSHRLRSAMRGADLVCRYGGEEFVVVMPNTATETAKVLAERLRIVIEGSPFVVEKADLSLRMTASFGIASMSHLTSAPEALMKEADKALYRAKLDGRNRVVAAAA